MLNTVRLAPNVRDFGVNRNLDALLFQDDEVTLESAVLLN